MRRVQMSGSGLSWRQVWALGASCFLLAFAALAARAHAFVYWTDVNW
jgi:hypothetical protein